MGTPPEIKIVNSPEEIKGKDLLVGGPYGGVQCDARGGANVLVVFGGAVHVYERDSLDPSKFVHKGVHRKLNEGGVP